MSTGPIGNGASAAGGFSNADAMSYADSLDAIFKQMASGTKSTIDLDKALASAMMAQSKAAKIASSEAGVLTKGMQYLAKESKGTGEVATGLAESLSEASGILTEAGERALDEQRKLFADMARIGGKNRQETAILGKTAANSEMEVYKNLASKHQGLATAAGYSKNGLGVISNGLLSMGYKTGEVAGSMGQYIGATSAVMGYMALAAGAFMALARVLAVTSQAALDASSAGMNFNGSLGASVAGGTGLTLAAQASAARFYGAVTSADLMQQLIDLNKDYGFGLVATGDAYLKASNGNTAYSNSLISGGFKVIESAAKIGNTLGMSMQESLKMVTTIHKVSNMSGKESVRAFFLMGEESKRLHVPMEGLMEVFSELGKSASFAGIGSTELMSRMRGLGETVKTLSGTGGFMNMSPEKIQESSKALAGFMTGMDSYRIAAATQGKGEGTFQAIYRAGSDKFKGTQNFLQSIGQQQGLDTTIRSMFDKNNKFMTGPLSEAQANALAQLGTMTGMSDPKNTELNKLIAAQYMAKGFTPADAAKMAASDVDRRVDATKSLGAQLSAGASPMTAMANGVLELVKLVTVIVGRTAGDWLMGATPAVNQAPVSRAHQAAPRYGNPRKADAVTVGGR